MLELLVAVCWPLRSELAEPPGTNAQRGPGRELSADERERIGSSCWRPLGCPATRSRARSDGRARRSSRSCAESSKASPRSRCD